MSLTDFLFNGALVVLAGLFATSCRGQAERRQLLLCWVVIASTWVAYISAWAPASPHRILLSAGVSISSPDLWSISDTIGTLTILAIAYNRLWGFALWLFLGVQIIGHEVQRLYPADFAPYTAYLDLWFRAQLATFVIIGGPGVWDRINHYFSRLRYGVGPHLAAQTRTASK